MRVLSSSLIGFACVATMAATATPAASQPSALALDRIMEVAFS